MAWGHAAAGGDGEEWRAVAPRRSQAAGRGREVRAVAAACAVLLGVIAVSIVVNGGGGLRAASLEQADVGLIAQEAMVKHSEGSPKISLAAASPAVAAAAPKAASPAAAASAPVVAPAADMKKEAKATALEEKAEEADLEREIKELEKQEAQHFAARQKALKAAAEATSKCAPTDSACLQAAKHVNWKMAKDQYEQAAMQDIIKQESKNVSETAGMAMFNSYSKLAAALSGVPQLKSLYNETSAEERSRTDKEHKALEELKTADHELHELEEVKRKLAHARQQKRQVAADAATTQSLHKELARLTYSQSSADRMFEDAKKQDAERQAKQRTTLSAYRHGSSLHNGAPNPKEIAFIDTNPYAADYAAAQKGEQDRSSAFRDYVSKLHAQDMAARAKRDKQLAAESKARSAQGGGAEASVADHLQQSAAKEASSSQYSADVKQALQEDAQRQKDEEAAIEAAKTKEATHAQQKKATSDAEVTGAAAEASAVVAAASSSTANLMSSAGYEQSVADAEKREAAKAREGQQQLQAFRQARAKVLQSDDQAGLSKMQSHLDSTAADIVGIAPAPVKKAVSAEDSSQSSDSNGI